ncbi:hypothetical protein [Spirochaeta isovalerica]|uniref:Cache domain-containing protein n=1 Tax=Spirochaeta isovalerica TaxID=150 RepID=A0A841RC49_9SPIO|nr:hypothetical protein [Spirochaeta isovalerica]MBB6480580.1 hypothetical protein [Spirochaeta isovalerica]
MKGLRNVSVFISILLLLSSCGSFDKKKVRADEMAERITLMIKAMESYAVETADKVRPYFENPEDYEKGLYDDAVYEFYENVIYHNPVDQGHGKFLYSGYFPVGEKEMTKVKVMENVIPHLQWLVNEAEYSDYITQTYLITYDTLIVFYPWSDLISFIPPRRNIMDRGGWKTLNRENNPDRRWKWTPPYVDTTGKGFMVDLMLPVDNGDIMEAFLGIDIIISTIKEKFFDDSEENYLLVDEMTSQIIAISSGAVDLLGVENAEAFRYLNMIDNSNIYEQVMPDNLVLEKTNSPHMKELWLKGREAEDFVISISGKPEKVYKKVIEGPRWYLFLLE